MFAEFWVLSNGVQHQVPMTAKKKIKILKKWHIIFPQIFTSKIKMVIFTYFVLHNVNLKSHSAFHIYFIHGNYA